MRFERSYLHALNHDYAFFLLVLKLFFPPFLSFSADMLGFNFSLSQLGVDIERA
jgi:hypothetical protein